MASICKAVSALPFSKLWRRFSDNTFLGAGQNALRSASACSYSSICNSLTGMPATNAINEDSVSAFSPSPEVTIKRCFARVNATYANLISSAETTFRHCSINSETTKPALLKSVIPAKPANFGSTSRSNRNGYGNRA